MANFVSPGVYIVEKDFSDYPVSVNPSVVGLVGFAGKGPVDKATLITSQEGLVKTFGEPDESIDGQALEGALEILEATNSLYFIRCASGGVEASAAVEMGGCPGVQVEAGGYGVTAGAVFKFQIYDNNGAKKFISPKTVTVGTGLASSQAVALKAALGGAIEASLLGGYYDDSTLTTGFLVAGFAGGDARLSISAYDTDGTTPLAILKAIDVEGAAGSAASTADVYGSTIHASSLSYLVQSLYPGAGYNRVLQPDGSYKGNSILISTLGSNKNTFNVQEGEATSESFVTSFVQNEGFIEDVINTGETSLTSEYIKGNIVSGYEDFTVTKLASFINQPTDMGVTSVRTTSNGVSNATANPRFIKLIEGTYALVNGTNGIPATDEDAASVLIGSEATDPKTGIYLLDDEVLNISMAAVPGYHNQTLQDALIALAERTGDFIAVVSPPVATSPVQAAIDWTNGQSETRTTALNSSYAAVYWPHVKVFSTFDGKDRWYDPSIFAIRQMAYTDEVSDPWFAPAGFVRGRLTKPSETELPLNQGDRDSLYSGGNVINPIVNFPQQGITIFGQRTTQRAATALDRVNVRRMMIVLRKILLRSTRQFAFEPNDFTTWERVTKTVEPLVDEIRRRRGITQFKVVCDETTNTPVRVDRGELWCKVLIKPTKAAEVIIFELNLTNQSADIG